MKCINNVKLKSTSGKTNLITCNTNLTENDLYCHVCGNPTEILTEDLSAGKNIIEVWKVLLKCMNRYLSFSLFMFFLILLPTFAASYFTRSNYWLNSLILLFTVPLILIPFSMKENFLKNSLSIMQYFRNFRYYVSYFQFTFVNISYFLFLKIICTGFLLNHATDPILHIVRLILTIYWLVIIIPTPFIIKNKTGSIFKMIFMSYKAGKETRWQQFYILIFLLILNVGGFILLGLGLLVSIPFSYILLEKYYLKMYKYKLFR